MAIILQHLTTGNEYIFLGVSGGESKPLLPKKMLGDLFSSEESDRTRSVTVCDDRGQILWFPVSEVIVVEVDGQKPEELLPEIVTPQPIPLQLDKENQIDISENEGNKDEFGEDDDWI
ncbi:hypothetical protein V0288_20870 [Pannus brasiliensis CCIBt3594]|uniref:Uncharacterized protein n=1 Tax=Pannus brasiliensis CCIBt3594 TaxID=1427578 RepID=A0AAW9QZU1_9CHRO